MKKWVLAVVLFTMAVVFAFWWNTTQNAAPDPRETVQVAPKPIPSEPLPDQTGWLSPLAKKARPVDPMGVSGPEGLGIWKACMPEEAVKVYPDLIVCPGTNITDLDRCYAPEGVDKRNLNDKPPIELWFRDRRLRRAVARVELYATPQHVGPGIPVHDIRAYYPKAIFRKNAEGFWQAWIPPLGVTLVTADQTSPDAASIPGITPIVELRVRFDCAAPTNEIPVEKTP